MYRAAAVVLATVVVSLAITTPAPAETKRVICALPFAPNLNAQLGNNNNTNNNTSNNNPSNANNNNVKDDCKPSTHKILFSTEGYLAGTKVTAELLGLDSSGNVLGSFEVKNGEYAHLVARTNSFKFATQNMTQPTGKLYEIFAPVPVLRVTADDGVTKSQAFCSSIPWVDVIQPANTVQTASEGDPTKVFAAIPRVDPAQLHVAVDGVDVFGSLGVSPAACTPATPCGGSLPSGATVSDLVVDIAANVTLGAANTVSMTLNNLSCGGHLVRVNSTQPPQKNLAKSCYIDDLVDTGIASVFSIEVTSPTDGQAGLSFPVAVTGEVCGGRPVTEIKINGHTVPAGEQIVQTIPGDGINTADTTKIQFQTHLNKTNLDADLANSASLGTFDEGSNRLSAVARDDVGNRTFDNLVFATGNTVNPGLPPLALSAQLGQILLKSVQDVTTLNATSVTLDNAFVVGLSKKAVQSQIDKRCLDPVNGVGKKFKDMVTQKLQEKVAGLAAVPVHPACSCNVDKKPFLQSVNINQNQVSCPVDFQDGKIAGTINLPNVQATVKLAGSCQTNLCICVPFTDECACTCATRTVVDFTSVVTISGIQVTFEINENQLLPTNNAPPPTVFVAGNVSSSNSGGVDIQCFLGDICEVALTIVTLGLVDFSPEINIDTSQDFKEQVALSKPDPVELNKIKVDESQVVNFDQTLSGEVTSVRITPGGLIAALRGTFTTTVLDPEVTVTPGAVLTGQSNGSPASVPTAPVAGAKDVFLALSDDTLGMMFASMTLGGKLKTQCKPTGKTIADLVPADCETMTGAGDQTTLVGRSATAAIRGICHAVRGNACEGLVQTILPSGAAGSNLLTAIEQGACHGTKGDTCDTIPTAVGFAVAEKGACNAAPKLNVQGTDPLLLCTREDIPPRPLVLGGSGGTVQAALRMNDLTAALVVDRGDPQPIDLGGLPPCIGTGGQATGDCRLYALCLDLNFNMDMNFQQCSDGKPGLVSTLTSLQILDRQNGVICGGASPVGDEGTVTSAAAQDGVITVDLKSKFNQFAPPACAKGFDLGGTLSCASPSLFAIKTDGEGTFKDYLGITCAVTP